MQMQKPGASDLTDSLPPASAALGEATLGYLCQWTRMDLRCCWPPLRGRQAGINGLRQPISRPCGTPRQGPPQRRQVH